MMDAWPRRSRTCTSGTFFSTSREAYSWRHEIELRVGGLFASQSSGKEHVEWLQRELRVGDRIVLTVTDAGDVDPPAHRTQEDPELVGKMERKYYRAAEGPIRTGQMNFPRDTSSSPPFPESAIC
jgi:hypothetical protein